MLLLLLECCGETIFRLAAAHHWWAVVSRSWAAGLPTGCPSVPRLLPAWIHGRLLTDRVGHSALLHADVCCTLARILLSARPNSLPRLPRRRVYGRTQCAANQWTVACRLGFKSDSRYDRQLGSRRPTDLLVRLRSVCSLYSSTVINWLLCLSGGMTGIFRSNSVSVLMLLWQPKARPLYFTAVIYYFVSIDDRPAMVSQPNLASRSGICVKCEFARLWVKSVKIQRKSQTKLTLTVTLTLTDIFYAAFLRFFTLF